MESVFTPTGYLFDLSIRPFSIILIVELLGLILFASSYVTLNEARATLLQEINLQVRAIFNTVYVSSTSNPRVRFQLELLFLIEVILVSNLIGLIPYMFTLTSHIAITFLLAWGVFFSINIVSALKWGRGGGSLILPSAAPTFVAPLLVPIELMTYISRVLSLSIRLFANMMAGHSLVHILVSFLKFAISMKPMKSALFVLGSILIQLILIMELAIAFIQAYVFLSLVVLYLADVEYPGAH